MVRTSFERFANDFGDQVKTSIRLHIFVLLTLAGLAPAISVASDVAAGPSTAEWKAMSGAFQAAGENRCDGVVAVIPAAIDRDTFSGFPAFVRRKALEHIVRCLRRTDEYAAFESYLQMLADMGGPNTPEVLRDLIWRSTFSKNLRVAVSAVKSLAEYGQSELEEYEVKHFLHLQRLLRNDAESDDLRYEFLQVLYENNVRAGNPFFTADELMIDYATMSIDRGNTQDIKKIILSFTDPGIIFQVRIDKRFDAIRQDDALEEFLDLENAADRHIDELERLVEKWPKYANGYVLYTNALTGSWRFEDALDVIEPIALKIREPGANEMFTDAEENTNWVLEAYARALYYEKYPEQSEDMFEEAVNVPEVGDINVNQRINLAGSIVFGGHFDRAMELLGKLRNENTNPFGRMWVNSITVCANAMREDPQDYSPNMTYLIAHEVDNPSALTQALLCANEQATAAQHLIRRIQNPVQRMVALLYLQRKKGDRNAERREHKHATTAGLTPGHILKHRFDQLRERDDLLDAVEQVGRIEEVPLHSLVWLRY